MNPTFAFWCLAKKIFWWDILNHFGINLEATVKYRQSLTSLTLSLHEVCGLTLAEWVFLTEIFAAIHLYPLLKVLYFLHFNVLMTIFRVCSFGYPVVSHILGICTYVHIGCTVTSKLRRILKIKLGHKIRCFVGLGLSWGFCLPKSFRFCFSFSSSVFLLWNRTVFFSVLKLLCSDGEGFGQQEKEYFISVKGLR